MMPLLITLSRRNILTDFVQQTIDWFNSDPRHYQIIFLTIFLFYGIAGLNWEVNEVNIILTFFVCFLTQSIFTALTTKDYRSLKSAAISALSLCLMLKTNSPICHCRCFCSHHFKQIYFRFGEETFFQSYQLRNYRHHFAHSQRLDFSRTVGKQWLACFFHRSSGISCTTSREAIGYSDCFSSHLLFTQLHSKCDDSRLAAGFFSASIYERNTAAVFILHDH